MKMTDAIQEFERSWAFSRQMTYDFIEAVPEEKWNDSPHPRYSPLCKQFRHMIWVTGLYRDALASKEMKPMVSKKSHYGGGLQRQEILDGLKLQDRLLQETLQSIVQSGAEQHTVKAFGAEMGFTEFTHLLLQHESTHHGLWSLYAALAGFSTPKSWVENWGL
jgi:hypothetical protein